MVLSAALVMNVPAYTAMADTEIVELVNDDTNENTIEVEPEVKETVSSVDIIDLIPTEDKNETDDGIQEVDITGNEDDNEEIEEDITGSNDTEEEITEDLVDIDIATTSADYAGDIEIDIEADLDMPLPEDYTSAYRGFLAVPAVPEYLAVCEFQRA